MMLLASGMLAFALIYKTVHTPNPPPMGVTAPQPTDSATVLTPPEVPPPPPTTPAAVSAEPPRPRPDAAPRAAPRLAPHAVPRPTALAHPAAPKRPAAPRAPLFVPAPPPSAPRPRRELEDTSNPYDDTTTDDGF
jgi:hypothetical protein